LAHFEQCNATKPAARKYAHFRGDVCLTSMLAFTNEQYGHPQEPLLLFLKALGRLQRSFASKEFDHMDKTKQGIQSIDDYIKTFPVEVQKKLQSIRKLIRKLAPEAEEKISYQIPTFYLNGNLVHFAGFKSHIGFYPTPSGISSFEKELSKYKQGKGSVQFPLDQPIPMDLIGRIVEFRLEKNRKKAMVKGKKVSKPISSSKRK